MCYRTNEKHQNFHNLQFYNIVKNRNFKDKKVTNMGDVAKLEKTPVIKW